MISVWEPHFVDGYKRTMYYIPIQDQQDYTIEIVPRGEPSIFRFWGFMLMNSRGGPPFGGLYVDEF